MKNLPVVIPSKNFHFVIVGPIGYLDGIIAKSSNVTSDIIGMANMLSRQDDEYLKNELGVTEMLDYQFAWSDYIVNNPKSNNAQFSEYREFRILLVWKYDGTSRVNNPVHKIRKEFEHIAQDVYNISTTSDLTAHERDNAILWLLSPIILFGRPHTSIKMR